MKWICKKFEELNCIELYQIMALRQEVFVVEQDCPYLDADGKDLKAWHLVGYLEDDLVAYARLLPQGVSYPSDNSIGRILTSQNVRGQGIGKKLVEESLRQLEIIFGTRNNKISAQCYLIEFYQSLGYKIVGEEYLEDGIPHIEMINY